MRIWVYSLVVALGVAGGVAQAGSGGEVLKLADNWQIRSSADVKDSGDAISRPGFSSAGWYPTQAPATVLAALVANKVYPDPFYGLNMTSIPGYKEGRWLLMPQDSPFRPAWWYRTEFQVGPALEGKNLTLHLDGINYRANVWLNGKKIADSADIIGMFRRFELPLAGQVRVGEVNALALEVFPPGLLPDKPYRTKQVEATTGWDDHNPQPPDANLGIWEDVYIQATGPARLRNPYVATDLELPSLGTAHLTVSTYATNVTAKPVKATVRGTIESITFAQDVELGPNETRLVEFTPAAFKQLNVAQPRVWWPNPVGPQELYDLELVVEADGKLSDTQRTHFGIRTITSYPNDEGWRTFEVNGRKILIRGGAWMTCDMLLRLTTKRYDALVRYAQNANLNMLRSEGFSIRETDEFYDLCDKYGVMVTQQLFGRSIPDENLAISCVEDTILRIRNHPSLAHFLGHDETFPTPTLDTAYRDLIAKYTPQRTYQPHSGAFEVAERFKTGGTRTGTRELWTYANPKHYYECKEDGAWGFAQSGGIGGIVAPYESVRRMMPADQQWPLWTEALSLHSVIQGGNYFDTVVKMLDARYGKPDDIQGFCQKAQAMNYESARGMFEAYGRNKYSATGITTWKYDASWPAFMTWHYVDWYLNAGGAYYGAKAACRPLHVQYSYDDNSVWVVNNYYKEFKGLKVAAKVYNMDASEKLTKTAEVNVAADGKVKAFDLAWPEGLSKTYFLRLTLEEAGKPRDDNFYWLSTVPDVRGTMKEDWVNFSVTPQSIADFTDLNSLPRVKLAVSSEFETKGAEQLAHVSVKNTDPKGLAFLVHIAVLKGNGGDEVTPAFWEDNYFSLLPGEEKRLTGVFYAEDLAGAAPVVKVDGWNVEP